MVKPLTYLTEVKEELAKVSWPDRAKTLNMTALVVGVSLSVALFVAAADFVFAQLLRTLIAG